MAKIILESTLIDNELKKTITNTKGIKLNNQIKFKENDILVTITIKNNTIEMNRSCSEYNLNLLFEKNKILVNDYNISNLGCIKLKVETLELNIQENLISIKYYLEIDNEKQLFNYNLKYELI